MDAIEKTRAFYEQNVEWWINNKVHSFYHEERFRAFLKFLKPGDSVLDIGCASGIHVPLFLGIGRELEYEGLDISSEMIRVARARYPQLIFHEGDIADFATLPKKTYDAFWAVAVLMHVPKEQWPQMLENIEHIVKKGGHGFLVVPEARPNPVSEKDQRHFVLFSDEQLKEIIQVRNWKMLEQGAYTTDTTSTDWRWYVVRLPE